MVLTRKHSTEQQRPHKGGKQGPGSAVHGAPGDHAAADEPAALSRPPGMPLPPVRATRGISRFAFELYLALVSLLQMLALVTLNLSTHEHLLHDLNLYALGVVVMFHLRRLFELSVSLEMWNSSDVRSPIISVVSPIVKLSVYMFATTVLTYWSGKTLVGAQFGKLLHPYWMYLLMWLLCFNWSVLYASSDEDGGRGGRLGTGGRGGGGKRSKGPAGGGAGSRSGGKKAEHERDRAQVASLEGQIVAELWRGLRTIVMESLILIYITCLLPHVVRQPSLYIDVQCTATVSAFFMMQTAVLLTMNHLHSNWSRYCQWADILGLWDPLSQEYLRMYQIDPKAVRPWATGNCWARGSIVKFNDRVYLATGKYNAATPGSRCSRFLQGVMAMPIQPASLILSLQAIVQFIQAVSLIGSPYWKLLLVNFLLGYCHVFVGVRMRRSLVYQRGAPAKSPIGRKIS